MYRIIWAALLGAAAVACGSDLETEVPLTVIDARGDDRGEGAPTWDGDSLIVETACTDLRRVRRMSLHEACDLLLGGRAFTGEDRIAATVFDDSECTSAAGFLPPPGLGGEVVLPAGRGRGVILRCAIAAEPS